jgi:hypothetical protein
MRQRLLTQVGYLLRYNRKSDLPGIIAGASFTLVAWLLTNSTSVCVALFGFVAGSVLTVWLIFIISEKIFSRIEYK